MVKEDSGSNLDRKLTLLTSDAGRWQIKDVPASSSGMDDGDVCSNVSSDLFEVENFSSKAHNPFLDPPPSDDMPSCYKPRETRFKWSIIAISAAIFSIASDYDNQKPSKKTITTTTTATMAQWLMGTQRRLQWSKVPLARYQNRVLDFKSAYSQGAFAIHTCRMCGLFRRSICIAKG